MKRKNIDKYSPGVSVRRTNPGKFMAKHEQEQIYAAFFVLIIKLRTTLIVIIWRGSSEESVTVRISQFYNVVSQQDAARIGPKEKIPTPKPALTRGKHTDAAKRR